jgi:hypothetical protein
MFGVSRKKIKQNDKKVLPGSQYRSTKKRHFAKKCLFLRLLLNFTQLQKLLLAQSNCHVQFDL